MPLFAHFEALLVVILILGCTREPAELDGAQCPCVEGFSCCPATGQCMAVGLAECPLELLTVEPQEGSIEGGTEIVVSGLDLPSDVEIRVADLLCQTADSDSKNAVVCRTPPGIRAGPASVSAHTAAGRIGVLEDAFVYLPVNPADVDPCAPATSECPITVLSVEPSAGPLAGDTRVVVRGADFPADMRLKFGARWCTDVVVVSGEEAFCRTPPLAAEATRLVTVRATGAENRVGTFSDAYRYLLPALTDETLALGNTPDEVTAYGVGATIADFDHDGILDLYFTLSSIFFRSGRSLFSSLGEFEYENRTSALGFSGIPNQHSLQPGDFDGDGLVDWLIGYRSSIFGETGSPLGLLRGRIGGRVDSATSIPMLTDDLRSDQHLYFVALDFEGDGDLDLLGCRQLGDELDPHRMLFQMENQDGALREITPLITESPEAAQTRCLDIAVADYDGDGDVDIALCGTSVRLYRNEGGNWRDLTAASGLSGFHDEDGALEGRCAGIDWVDVDGDGELDLTWTLDSAGGGGSGLVVARYNGGQFSPLVAAYAPPLGDEGCEGDPLVGTIRVGDDSVFWLDVDNDGDQDVLAPSPFLFTRCRRPPYLLRSHFAQGEARFSAETVTLQPAYGIIELNNATGGITADLDGDGDLDVITSTWGGARRMVLRNNFVENGGRPSLWIAPTTDPDGDATDTNTDDDFVPPHVRVEIDLDGPADAPDFAPGSGALTVSGDARGVSSHGPHELHFGLGERPLPVWVRVYFPDGSVTVQRVDELGSRVEVRDCASLRCGEQI